MNMLQTNSISTLIRELHADLETPVSVYLKLRGQGASFLLESVEGGEHVARYSFIGIQPKKTYHLKDGLVEVYEGEDYKIASLNGEIDPIQFLQHEIEQYEVKQVANAPRFTGGLVGYLSYEAVRFFEPVLTNRMHTQSMPDGIFMLADTLIAFDNVRHSIFLVCNVLDGDAAAAERKLDQIQQRIAQPLPETAAAHHEPSDITSNLTRTEFESMVKTAKEKITAGDIFQVVLSQRFTRQTQADAFDVYRAVRRLNPSPYMFFFDFGQIENEPLYLVGSSPELFVRLEQGIASLRPIAGTRPRGADAATDDALAVELLADPKERAEHVMLVDLGRNDLGRVCQYGSVKVTDFFTIERYSHVMHIVSEVQGQMRPGLTAFDLLRAAFPAGTVSGAPKVRAMEIISALEKDSRNAYAGMVGYFGFDGAMDTCLTIRTMIGRGGSVSVQAGAGIVADSDPATEYQETVNKASAMLRAIDLAESTK
jgi:anthranilate synthase component I